jgi:hypothetical protein
MAETPVASAARIGFPVNCDYRGGIDALGNHGKHRWIKDGKLGHGSFTLTHQIPLSSV